MFILYLIMSFFMILCVSLVSIICIQDSSAKLGTGFGVHDTSSDSLLGSSVPKFVKKLTTTLIMIYFSLAIIIANAISWQGQVAYSMSIDKVIEQEQSAIE